MSIKIGNKNKIKNTTIAGHVTNNVNETKSGFYQKHPIISGLIISFIAGIILLFSFWKNIALWIEGVF